MPANDFVKNQSGTLAYSSGFPSVGEAQTLVTELADKGIPASVGYAFDGADPSAVIEGKNFGAVLAAGYTIGEPKAKQVIPEPQLVGEKEINPDLVVGGTGIPGGAKSGMTLA